MVKLFAVIDHGSEFIFVILVLFMVFLLLTTRG